MKKGEVYGLSAKGLHILSLMGYIRGVDINDNTRITVDEDDALPCDCHSVNARHTDDCASHYQRMKISGTGGKIVYLSAEEVRGIAETALS